MMRSPSPLAALLCACLAACTRPPPSAYVGVSAGVAIGRNAAGEACTLHARAEGADIFCGSFEQPSARIRHAALPAEGGLAALAASSPWRVGLDSRLLCGPPSQTTILGDLPALAMACERRIGGWPQAALLAQAGETAWLADGVLPALPVMERGIGQLAGRLPKGGAAASEADALFASRLAAEAFGSNDIGRYDELMAAGKRANLAENYASAEQAYRAALALQRRVLGADNPNTVDALGQLALQISDQGRYGEADALFAEAMRLAPRDADPLSMPRLLHARALDALNQGQDAAALALLRQSEAGYAALLSPEALAAHPAIGGGVLPGGNRLLVEPTQQAALIGVLEARRYEAIALRALHRPAESAEALAGAVALARANGLDQPGLTARLLRTAAATAAAGGDVAAAVAGLRRSTLDFDTAQPGSRPVAETALLHAAELARQQQSGQALAVCRQAVALLVRLQSGIRPALLDPCLALYAAQAASLHGAAAQGLLAEMFAAAQLAQASVTSQQIAQAAARLAAGAQNPRVGTAIRRRQDAGQALAALYTMRDLLPAEASRASRQALEKQIAAAQAALADADEALQVASPNYGQLVQQMVPASAVLTLLRPGEAFAAITLGERGGWVFLLHDGQIALAPVAGGEPRMAELVRRVRAGVEPTTAALPAFDTAAAIALYAETLGQLAPAMAGVKALVVAPSGPLLSLPFGLLLTGPAAADRLAGAPWLIRRMSVAHVPAAANFVALRKIADTSRAARPWFGFGDFHPVTLAQAERSFPTGACADSARLFAGLAPLPYAVRELAAARQLVGGGAGDELLGAAFTAAAVRAAALDQYRILHFATHALLPAELRCEAEPAIVTSDPPGAIDASGALLSATEVAALRLDADAVILSACNSGGPGGTTAGESLSGLARAFFYAGARALLVTHWAVNDQSAAFLVADTLRRLRAGEPDGIAGALRAAQLGILDGAGHSLPADLAHPFFWAPFAVIGEGRVQPVAGAFTAAGGGL